MSSVQIPYELWVFSSLAAAALAVAGMGAVWALREGRK